MNASVNSGSEEPDLYAGPVALTINSAGAHTHTVTVDSRGGGQAISLMQPYMVLSYLIKT
jgi:microcystin-dependent protein